MTTHTRLIHAAQVRGLALVALSVSLSVSLCASLFSGCDPQSLPPTADLSGLSQLAFQCVNLKTRPAETAPLERCGCLSASLSDEGARVLSEVSGSECTTDPNFRILGYLGSSTQEKVGVVDLKSEVRGIFDQDQSIPGISHFSAGGLISSLRVHPYGDFMFIVRGDTGEVALSSDYRNHQPNLSVDLEQGPLSFSAIWPKENQLLPEDGSPSYLYVSAPLRNRILEVDLDLLSLALTDALAGEEIGSRDVITRTWDLTDERGAPIAPGQLSINTSGDLLSVAHADTPRITLISLDPSAADTPERGAAVLGDIDLHPRLTCADTYIVEPLIVTRAAETCVDGIDNDQDGFIDQDDLKCALYKTEAIDLACPQSDTCADGVDNDQDDLVDAEDPDCDEVSDDGERREGSAPECDDGIDNDGDGLIDRADDGCADQRDPREAYTLERGELCEDGEDNDSDGLIDDEDPGCSDPDGAQRYLFERRAECTDGLDNDGDGLIDYPEDLDCTHAASHRESPLFPARGPQLLEIVTLELASGTREVIVTDGPDGALLLIDVLSADEVDVPSLPVDPEADDQSPLFFKQTPLFDISYPHSLEVISSGELTTLWVIDQNTTLHTVHLSAPVPARTITGERIYAQGEIGAPSTETASPSGEVERVIDVEAYYIVRDGVAYQLPLDALLGEIPYDPLTQVPMVSEEINAELQTLDPTALSELPRLALSDSGADAPEVFLDLDYQRAETRWNRYRTALSQSNRVVAEPKFSLNDVRVNANVTRHVGFCELSTLSERDETQTDDEESNTGACDLVGGLVSAEVDELNKSTLVSYRGVVSTEERHDFVISGRVGVAYEGAIPNSRQNNGRHIGQGEDTWRLANEQSDFCALGVEEGDLVIVDRFYPQDAAAASDPECRPFIQRTPGEGVDPLRYRVSKVSQRALTLTTDPRDSYAPQLDLLGSSRLPKLAPALPPPPARCAAQTISYEIRVGRDQWLVESNALGYRHPWVARDGECVRSPERVSRRQVGRARLGEVYAGEWFTFKLGYQAASAGQGGIPTGQLPLMVGTRYDFFMERGALRASIQSVGPAPQSIRWLPELNRLFIVDVALKQVSEYTGLDPYLETIRAFTVFR